MATLETSPPAVAPSRTDPALPRRLALVAAVLLLAHLPLLYVHAQQLWLRPHYQFFPVVVLGAAVLAAARLREGVLLTPGSMPLAGFLLAAAWGTLLLAVGLYSSWLAAVAMQLLLLAVAYTLGGGALVRRLLPAWLLLWLAVPLPFKWDEALVLALQTLTTRWSSDVLDLLGVWHVMAGHVVEVGGRRLLVEEACSGVNSLFSVLGCTLFFVFWARRGPLHGTVLVLTAVGWVLVANVARVVLITCAGVWWGVNLTDGWRHDAVGFGLFALALLLIWSTDRLLLFLGGRAAAPAAAASDVGRDSRSGVSLASAGRTWLASPAVAGLYGLLILAHLALYGLWPDGGSAPGPAAAALARLSAATLPAQAGPWRQESFAEQSRNPGSAYGESSRSWAYRHGHLVGTLSVDFPFTEWHELTTCYVNQGWALGAQEVRAEETGGAEELVPVVEVRMARAGHRSGQLWFCEFDSRGRALQPRRTPAAAALTRHTSALRRWWRALGGEAASAAEDLAPPIHQVQLFVETYAPLTAEERAQARRLFLDLVAALRRQWAGAGNGS